MGVARLRRPVAGADARARCACCCGRRSAGSRRSRSRSPCRANPPDDWAVLLAVPGGALGNARPVRLLPRHADGDDERGRADRGRVGDRAGRLRDRDRRPAVARSSSRGSPARSSASRSRRRSTRQGERRVAAGRLARGARRDRLRLLLPADARRGRGRPVVGVADLPHDRARCSSSSPSPARRPDVRLRGWPLVDRARRRHRRHAREPPLRRVGDHGLVSVTSVLASLYPVVTVGLAAIVLKEHVAGGQRARRRPDAHRRRPDRRLTYRCGRSSQSCRRWHEL